VEGGNLREDLAALSASRKLGQWMAGVSEENYAPPESLEAYARTGERPAEAVQPSPRKPTTSPFQPLCSSSKC